MTNEAVFKAMYYVSTIFFSGGLFSSSTLAYSIVLHVRMCVKLLSIIMCIVIHSTVSAKRTKIAFVTEK